MMCRKSHQRYNKRKIRSIESYVKVNMEKRKRRFNRQFVSDPIAKPGTGLHCNRYYNNAVGLLFVG